MLINLLDNSIRALGLTQKINPAHRITHNEKQQIRIKTRFKPGRNQVELLFSDNGPGIPFEVKDKLFLPHVSSSKKNMGLGLAIVHDAITQMGGNIRLLPTTQGAAFKIMLPI